MLQRRRKVSGATEGAFALEEDARLLTTNSYGGRGGSFFKQIYESERTPNLARPAAASAGLSAPVWPPRSAPSPFWSWSTVHPTRDLVNDGLLPTLKSMGEGALRTADRADAEKRRGPEMGHAEGRPPAADDRRAVDALHHSRVPQRAGATAASTSGRSPMRASLRAWRPYPPTRRLTFRPSTRSSSTATDRRLRKARTPTTMPAAACRNPMCRSRSSSCSAASCRRRMARNSTRRKSRTSSSAMPTPAAQATHRPMVLARRSMA